MTERVDQPAWRATPERGNRLAVRFMVWFTLRLGRRLALALLPAVALYFYATSPQVRRASRAYLGRALGRPAGQRDVYRHIHTFALMVVDRVHFFAGRLDQFDIRVHGVEALDRALERSGCVIMGAHLGSFEALRAAARQESPHEVVMLMDEANAQMIGQVLASLNPEAARGIINVGDPGSVLKAKERLDQGALVGVLGDRLRPGDTPMSCEFFGAPAQFPHGPFAVAVAMRAPVYLGFGLYRGGNRYDVYFEQLSERIDCPRSQRAQVLAQLARGYASRLEHYARMAPYNWFNFYDFWEATK